ncbi:MAG: outer membrane lipoprotein-sorting protein [Termitinemataceae bacterium]|nr:MAG: outer membrane lipoprotein-sorting protein [Termitinemataceae bacterium]
MLTKKTFFLLSFIVFISSAWGTTDDDLLKKVDSLASYYNTDFSAEYTIVQDKPGGSRSTTVASLFRRDSKEMYTIVIKEPSISRGQGYLKQGKTLWFYDPESKRFNSTSSSERFQNSNARNSDFTRSTLANDYKIEDGENVTLGKYKCRLLTLTATSGEVAYPHMKVWISEDGLVRKTEDYSLSWQLLRITAIPEYNKIGKRFVPKAMLLVDALRGATINGKFVNEKTQITISNPSFSSVKDSTFSKAFLEQVGR